MRRVLLEWFGEGYHKVNQQQNSQFGMQKLATQDQEGNWLPEVRCIQAHFHHGHGFGLPYFYPEIDQYVTILRDPFDLMVSMYFFIKGRSKQGQFWFRGRPVDISQKYPNIESYLRSYPYWMFSHLPQNLTLVNYRQKLASQFVYIGVYEDLQTSIDRLAAILGQPTMPLLVSNASEYDENVPNHLRAQFYHDYPLPKKIYDFALEHYLDASPADVTDGADGAEGVNHEDAAEPDVNLQARGFQRSMPLGDDEVISGDMSMAEES